MKSKELSAEIKSRTNRILRYGPITEKYLAEHIGTNIKMIKRMRKGKIPPRYERDDVIDKLRRTWVHYEQSDDHSLEMRS